MNIASSAFFQLVLAWGIRFHPFYPWVPKTMCKRDESTHCFYENFLDICYSPIQPNMCWLGKEKGKFNAISYITVSSQFSSVYIYWAVIYFLLFIPFITNVNVNPVHLPGVPQKASPSTIHLHSENILCLSYSDEQFTADAAILSCDCGPISGLKIRELSPFCYFSVWSDLTYSLLKSDFICLIDFHLFRTVGNLSHKNVHFPPWGSVK